MLNMMHLAEMCLQKKIGMLNDIRSRKVISIV